MANDTLADVLILFTKVNSKLVKRLEDLEKGGINNKGINNKPEDVVAKVDQVEVESFGDKAIKQLGAKFGVKSGESNAAVDKKEKKGNGIFDWLLSMLGIASGGIGVFKDKIKKWILEKLGNLITSSLELIKDGLKGLWNGIKGGYNFFKKFTIWGFDKLKAGGAKLMEMSKNAWEGIKNSKVGKSIGSFFSKMGKGLSKLATNVIEGGKALGSKLAAKTSSFINAAKNVAGRAGGAIKNVAGGAVDAGKNLAGRAVAAGTNLAGRAVAAGTNLAERALSAGAKVKDFISNFGKRMSSFKGGGKLFGKLLSRIPLIGSLIEGFLTSSDIQTMIDKHMKDPKKYTEKMLYDDIGGRITEGLGGMLGAAGGATLGATAGSIVPGFGTFIGGLAGGALGDYAGRAMGGALGQVLGDKKGEIGEYIYGKFYKKGAFEKQPEFPTQAEEANAKFDGNEPVIETEDAVITTGGKVIQPHKEDTLYAMKGGGPMDKFFNENLKVSKNNNDTLTSISNLHGELLTKQLLELFKNNKLLTDIKNNLEQGATAPRNVSIPNKTSTQSYDNSSYLRAIQYSNAGMGSIA